MSPATSSILLAALLAVFVGCAPRSAPEPTTTAGATLAIVGATVLPTSCGVPLEDRTILVRDGRIAEIGMVEQTPVPPGAERIDAHGRWVVAGLTDAHVHFTSRPAIDYDLLPLYLDAGVTSVLVMEGSPSILALRDSVHAGLLRGPTMHLAGPAVRDSTLTRASGADLVDRQRAAGYDFIKVYNQASREGMRGILRRAREVGMPVVGHVSRELGLEGTIGGGQHGIVHMEEYLYAYLGFRNSDTVGVALERLDPEAIPYLAAISARADVWVTPTLITFERILGQALNVDSVLAAPGVERLPPALISALWAPDVNRYANRFTHPQHHENLQAALEYQRSMVRTFHEAGVRILAGTDAPIPGVVPGIALHDELRNLVEAGLQPCEALEAATTGAAEYLGLRGQFGSVTVGSRADLLLLNANPVDDLETLTKPIGIVVRGRWIARDGVEG